LQLRGTELTRPTNFALNHKLRHSAPPRYSEIEFSPRIKNGRIANASGPFAILQINFRSAGAPTQK
jgi:hypothetical protein